MLSLIFLFIVGVLNVLGWAQSPTTAPATPSLAEPVPVVTEAKIEWKPKLEWLGDLRYRLAKARESIDETRTYQQLRARLGLKADVNESVRMVLRLATGTSAISTNQTLGDAADPGMPRRGFGLDLAYIDWKLGESGLFWAGRTANPFWTPAKTQLIFDSDLAFEGLAFKWEPQWSNAGAFVNVGAFMISENYAAPYDTADVALAGVDVGFSIKAAGQWTFHVGNYYYIGVKDTVVTAIDKSAKTDPYSYPYDRYRGNTVYPNDPLLPADQRKYFFRYDYNLLEAGMEWKKKWDDVELLAFFDVVKNQAVSKGDIGQEIGIGGKWRWLGFGVAQVTKGADFTLAAFTDSDANGGGTDNDGYRFQLTFQLSKNALLSLTELTGKRGVDSTKRDFNGTHFDLVVNF